VPELILEPLAARLAGRSPLDPGDRQAIVSLPHSVKFFRTGTYFIRQGQQPSHCWFLIQGSACRHKIVVNGGRQIVGLHLTGSLVDFQASLLRVADENVQALTSVQAAAVPLGAVASLIEQRPAVLRALFEDAVAEASIFREWIANVGRRDSRARLAHLLCELAVRQQAAGLSPTCLYQMPMTQEQIADVVGLTPVHVNRTLRVLESEGLIRRVRRQIEILDWNALQQAGDFQPSYLHLPEPQPYLQTAA
jgi:CRP-like cAMP-binding protein